MHGALQFGPRACDSGNTDFADHTHGSAHADGHDHTHLGDNVHCNPLEPGPLVQIGIQMA